MEEIGGFQSGTTTTTATRLATLTSNNTFTPTATTADRCTMCGSSSSAAAAKRRSPYSSLQEPTPKKQLFSLPTPKLPPPITCQIASPSSGSNFLRRCASDPTNPRGPTQFLNPQSPPIPPVLRRSVSDPLSTPPRGPPRTSSQSPNSAAELELGSELVTGESPNSKVMRRMKDQMREMMRWWDQFVSQEEGGGGVEDNNNNGDGDKNAEGGECTETTETEEAVSVERTGECLTIRFKCSCNKNYQILLSGKDCYYKLL